MNNTEFGKIEIQGTQKEHIKQENIFVITDAKLVHIESLANRADEFIKQEPRWDIYKIWMSASASVAISTLLTLLPIWFGDSHLTTIGHLVHLSLLISALAISGFCYFSNKYRDDKRNTQHDSYIIEIKKLLKSLREE